MDQGRCHRICRQDPKSRYADAAPFDLSYVPVGILRRMDVERLIDDIEQIREMFEAPDIRPLSANDISAANQRHDEVLANSPWFKLWQQFGVCCRGEAEGSPRIQS